MHNWHGLVKEVLTKSEQSDDMEDVLSVRHVSHDTPDISDEGGGGAVRELLPKRRYVLDDKHTLYLTYREAQCMLLFIHGKTVLKVAQYLALSPRTVEYYLNNMKSKFNCRTKSELIEQILQTPFLKQTAPLRQELSLHAVR